MTDGLNVRIDGEGPDLVLVHGWGMRLQVWDDLVARLRGHYRLIRVDLPGHGASRGVGELATSTLERGLRDTIHAPARWIGWSLGGLLTLQLAQQRPDWFERLCLAACNPCFVRRGDWPGVEPGVFAGFADGLERDLRRTWLRFASLVAEGERQRDVLRVLREAAGSSLPDADALIQGLSLLAEDLRQGIENITCPLCWLLGGQDALVPVDVGRHIETRIATDRVGLIAGAGHAPFLSHPESFISMLDPFMAEQVA